MLSPRFLAALDLLQALLAEWEALGADGQWDEGMRWVRSCPNEGLRFQPSNWLTWRVNDGQTLLDVRTALEAQTGLPGKS